MGKVRQQSEDKDTVAVTISQAAAAAGLSKKAVRLYEARGLLAVPARTASGYRLYTDAEIARLRFIATARQIGLHIDQIGEILAAAQDGRRPCRTTNQLLERPISEIDRAIAELSILRTTLTAAHAASAADADGDITICPVLQNPRLRGDART